MAALSRFIARLGDRGLPFFKLLRQSNGFTWTEEADKAFEDLKKYLATPPILVAPEPDEELFLYIASGPKAVSGVLVVERAEHDKQEKVQKPVYFISEVLHGLKERYP